MRGLKRFMYSIIGIIIFVVLPAFFIISNHLEKKFPGNDYVITNLIGQASVQYQIDHKIKSDSDKSESYRKKSEWIPLTNRMKIGSGALIKTEKNASLDIMKNNEVAIRIKGDSIVKFEHHKTNTGRTDATLDTGKIFCRVNGDKQKKTNLELLRVMTPNATAHVRGTTFSVNYQPNKRITHIDVLNGLVAAISKQFHDMEFKIQKGKRLKLASSQQYPIFDLLNPDAIKELRETQDIKIAPSITDRWDEALFYVSALPLYRKTLIEITRYEMKVFIRAIRYFAPLRWNYNAPKSLKDVKLDDGDYKDPWNTDYLYERLGPKKAILISAGADKIFHTSDDIYMAINL